MLLPARLTRCFQHTRIVLPHSQISTLTLVDSKKRYLFRGFMVGGRLLDNNDTLLMLVKIGSEEITRNFKCLFRKESVLVLDIGADYNMHEGMMASSSDDKPPPAILEIQVNSIQTLLLEVFVDEAPYKFQILL